MDPKLLAKSAETMPQFTADVCSGFHKREFDNAEKFYQKQLKMTFESLESRGVFFKGVKAVRPDEMFRFVSEMTQNKTFEINKESLYPCRLVFEIVDGSGAPRLIDNIYVMLPFTDDYGDVWIRGSLYSLQIVMADRGLSVTKDEQILVKILGSKFKIGIENTEILRVYNDVKRLEERRIPLNLSANRFYSPSEAFQVNKKYTPIPLLAWYMFAVYGFSKTMQDFAECDYVIGSSDTVAEKYHLKDGWQVFTNTGKVNEKIITNYIDVGLSIAVRNKNPKRWKDELSVGALQYVGALIYLWDVAPGLTNPKQFDDIQYWRLIIGHCSMSNKNGEESIMKQMADHFDSMSERLDETSVKRFASQHILVKNMFELFNYIITNRTEIVKTYDRADMFHKELCSMEYTLDRLVVAANRFKHDVKNSTDLNFNKIRSFMASRFNLREVERSAWESNMVQEPTPTDCPLLDYVLAVIPQTRINVGMNRGVGDFNPNDPANVISASLPFVMSAERVTKSYPDGRGYLSPCVYLINGRITALDPKLRGLYEETHERLTTRITREK